MDPALWTAIVAFIKDVGFPVFVAVYVLTRLERALTRLTVALANIERLVGQLSGRRKSDAPP